MNGFLKLMRPVNAVMASVGTIIGGIISFGSFRALYDVNIYFAMLTVFLVLMAGNIMNDYFDIEVDKINHPDRPLASGKIKKDDALVFAVVFFIMGYLISLFTFKIVLSLIVMFAIALLVSYEWKAKKAGLIGNIIISFLVALIFIYGSLSVKFSFLVLIFAFMAFLANLSREIIKDVEDMEGDIDRRTLPMKIGKKLSTVFASVFLLIAITISPIPYLYFHWNIYYLIAVLLADILFLVSIIFSFNNPKRGQEFIKFGMLVGLVAFLIGGAV